MPNDRRTFRRLAAVRAARRLFSAIPPPQGQPSPPPVPALECPDDDREFVAILSFGYAEQPEAV